MARQYNIARSAGQCFRCEKELGEREEFMAVIRDEEGEFQRQDWCLACWDSDDRDSGQTQSLFGQWRTRMPARQARKRTFVDDEMLVGFFQRLAGATEPARQSFRFVLALVLMRKKLLVYERSDTDDAGEETWTMRLKGTDETQQVLNPRLDEDKIDEVGEQLSQILQGAL